MGRKYRTRLLGGTNIAQLAEAAGDTLIATFENGAGVSRIKRISVLFGGNDTDEKIDVRIEKITGTLGGGNTATPIEPLDEGNTMAALATIRGSATAITGPVAGDVIDADDPHMQANANFVSVDIEGVLMDVSGQFGIYMHGAVSGTIDPTVVIEWEELG